MTNEQEQLQKALVSWGKQTIVFALCLTAQADGEPLDNPTQVKHANNAAQQVVSELWQDTAKECPQPARFTMAFVRKVLDWAHDHRHS